jgi:hypothetical protein
VTRPGGYVLKLAPEALDAHRFEQLVDDARDVEPRDAAAMLRDALALWRGPPLADFTYRSAIHALACRTLGIRHLRTRPRRPQTNGRQNGSFARCWAAEPTARSTARAENAPRPLTAGYGPTTIAADTQASGARQPSPA